MAGAFFASWRLAESMATKSGSMLATFVRMCSFAADFLWMYFAQSMQQS
jgi:hypothetical protein